VNSPSSVIRAVKRSSGRSLRGMRYSPYFSRSTGPASRVLADSSASRSFQEVDQTLDVSGRVPWPKLARIAAPGTAADTSSRPPPRGSTGG